MINLSRLASYSRQDLQRLLLLLRELLTSENVKISIQSRPVILFLSTLVSTAGIGVFFTIRNILTKLGDRAGSRRSPRPALIPRSSSHILQDGAREIMVPNGSKGHRRITIPKPELDKYAADKYLYKSFVTQQRGSRFKNSIFSSKFLSQLSIICQVLLPRFRCKNTSLLLSQCFFLILRTWLSLVVARLDGQIVKNLISGNGRKFARDLIYWLLIAFPASYTNAAIKYLTSRLSLAFRTNLTRYIHDMYLDKVMAYYKITLGPRDIENIDQYITNDVAMFCDSFCGLFSSMGKPLIDLMFFSVYLRDTLGTGAIIGIFSNYFLTAALMKQATPAFGKLSSRRTHLEGQYFNQHSNLVTNCEEIAFCKGSMIEKTKLGEKFKDVMDHLSTETNASFNYSVLEDYVLKYTWSAWGYIFAGLPVFLDEIWPAATTETTQVQAVDNAEVARQKHTANESHDMRQFITNKRLMLALADAGSRLMYSIKDISKLTGYTDRVFNLLTALHKCHSPRFDYGSKIGFADIRGTLQSNYSSGIRLENVHVIVPTVAGSEAAPLVDDLSLQVQVGCNVLILGANGCGKTSIARILAGLWPLYRGLLLKPSEEDVFYLPQKTYFSAGTLRDQVIYPFRHEDMLEMGRNDEYLLHILHEVKLEYLVEREGSFNAQKDWKDVLSGGEKQRMSLARVLFKNPKIVVLDESTNAMSTDIEDYLFELLQRKKITYLTLSHRPLLMKYHHRVLEIESETEWKLVDLTTPENLLSIDNEIAEIKDQLGQAEEWAKRMLVVNQFLEQGEIMEAL